MLSAIRAVALPAPPLFSIRLFSSGAEPALSACWGGAERVALRGALRRPPSQRAAAPVTTAGRRRVGDRRHERPWSGGGPCCERRVTAGRPPAAAVCRRPHVPPPAARALTAGRSVTSLMQHCSGVRRPLSWTAAVRGVGACVCVSVCVSAARRRPAWSM